ncbi:hypothetical protein BKA66DRAFT_436245 [Pyrenochaeta sp. MPI-SDFR-AT-0127]|nr:hypothetical protein BKA66DRAFT_436245 [Pyrenochaeta sp. MPI-SDFR-AT-0127]
MSNRNHGYLEANGRRRLSASRTRSARDGGEVKCYDAPQSGPPVCQENSFLCRAVTMRNAVRSARLSALLDRDCAHNPQEHSLSSPVTGNGHVESRSPATLPHRGTGQSEGFANQSDGRPHDCGMAGLGPVLPCLPDRSGGQAGASSQIRFLSPDQD